MRLIDADRLKSKIKRELYASHSKPIIDWIDAQPTITERTAELKKELGGLYCSSCECDIDEINDDFNYCPNCGAKFEGAE